MEGDTIPRGAMLTSFLLPYYAEQADWTLYTLAAFISGVSFSFFVYLNRQAIRENIATSLAITALGSSIFFSFPGPSLWVIAHSIPKFLAVATLVATQISHRKQPATKPEVQTEQPRIQQPPLGFTLEKPPSQDNRPRPSAEWPLFQMPSPSLQSFFLAQMTGPDSHRSMSDHSSDIALSSKGRSTPDPLWEVDVRDLCRIRRVMSMEFNSSNGSVRSLTF